MSSSRPSCSATPAARSPGRPRNARDSSRKPTAARCFSTKSANCRPGPRPSCFESCRKGRSSASARTCRDGSTCASSPQPTGVWRTKPSHGRFRTDLRFRLDVLRIVVPPLRDRASRHSDPGAAFLAACVLAGGIVGDARPRRARGVVPIRLAGQCPGAAERDRLDCRSRPAPRPREHDDAAGAACVESRWPPVRSKPRAKSSNAGTCAPRSRRRAATGRSPPGPRRDAARAGQDAPPPGIEPEGTGS